MRQENAACSQATRKRISSVLPCFATKTQRSSRTSTQHLSPVALPDPAQPPPSPSMPAPPLLLKPAIRKPHFIQEVSAIKKKSILILEISEPFSLSQPPHGRTTINAINGKSAITTRSPLFLSSPPSVSHHHRY
ncbi:hypothetical protein MRB53_001909 [Persea americana]|uniref:Uncharacterized protein n=1 Tax=Persea americana TaxID=3435 RepID=A0ACC2MT85_PERAE|nr:hypothetical protein MRB53_001909 [Persea americana]